MNKQALLDKLSEFLMVEQCGWQLYRVVGSRTTDPELAERYQHFGQETDHHRTILINLIRELGGDPDYVSAGARVAQAKNEALLATALVCGPLTEPELEVSDLENVLLAETKDHADWEFLGKLAERLPSGKARDAIQAAVAEVGSQEDEHLQWAATQLGERSLRAVMDGVQGQPERLERYVIEPDLPVKDIHAAPIDKRSLLDLAKTSPFEETPASRTANDA